MHYCVYIYWLRVYKIIIARCNLSAGYFNKRCHWYAKNSTWTHVSMITKRRSERELQFSFSISIELNGKMATLKRRWRSFENCWMIWIEIKTCVWMHAIIINLKLFKTHNLDSTTGCILQLKKNKMNILSYYNFKYAIH